MPDLPLTGHCNCGAVGIEVSEPLVAAHYCHCTRCQRRTGTAASVSATPAAGSFRITQGEGRLGAWKPEDGWEKWFCADCGSAVFSHDPKTGQIGVRMGIFDRDPGVRPSSRIYVAYAAPWEPIPDDGLPRYDQGPP